MKLAGTYEEAVLTLNEHTASPGPPMTGGRERWAERLTRIRFLRWWLRDPVERVGFLLTAVQLTRTRDVKLRIYPQVGQFAVYPLIFAVGGRGQPEGIGAAFAAGFLGMIAMNTVMLLRYSEEYRGSELFRFVPLTSPAELFFGARKAVMIFVIAPVVLLWAVLLLAINRDLITLLMLLPGVLLAHIMSLLPAVVSPLLPFSETQADSKGQGTAALRMFAGLAGAMVVGGITWFAQWAGYLAVWLVFLLIATGVCDFLFRRAIRRQPISSDE